MTNEPNLNLLYWIIGFFCITNFGTLIAMVTAVIKFAFFMGRVDSRVEKLEKDVQNQFNFIRGRRGEEEEATKKAQNG